MKWTLKPKQIGDKRIKRKFLIIPRCFENQARWLEWANIEETYMEVVDFADGSPHVLWLETNFMEVRKMTGHKSDCAVYNEPAYPKSECDCGYKEPSIGMKYRKKPVVIEAIQFTSDSADKLMEIQEFMQKEIVVNYEKEPVIKIATLEGVMNASISDYIIKGVNGEFYPCKPDIFEKTYEVVK